MSGIVPYQICASADGWVPVLVPSKSQKLDYRVMVSPWDNYKENICECAGYSYQGHCYHQELAQTMLCRWSARTGPEEQTDDQRDHEVCPRCGGPSVWRFYVQEGEANGQ